MKKRRCLGLIGGLGVGATVYYYRRLAKAHEERGRTLDMVITHAEVPRVFEYAGAGDRDGLAEYLMGFILRLRAAGAEFIAIPAVTPHLCMRELEATSPLPLFNIFDPLVDELVARGVRRAAVFGSRYVIESSLFGMAGNVQIVLPTSDEVNFIHNIYSQLSEKGVGTEEQHRDLTALADTLRHREGVDAIIMAGTDLTTIFNEGNTPFPYVDCAALHLERIVKGLLDETS
jgi:aspartate racemase